MRGIALEKNGPCSWENEVKISKKRKMAKNHFSRADFGSSGVFLFVLGAISGTPKMAKTTPMK